MNKRVILPIIIGILLIGSIAGVSISQQQSKPTAVAAATPTAASSATPVAAGTASPAADATPTATTAAGAYKDGSYTAEGTYDSPGGTGKIGVAITLANDSITAVTVTPEADNPQSDKYEHDFAGGIAGVVVGKPIGTNFNVSKVNGSSLTSTGFMAALKSIEAQAAS